MYRIDLEMFEGPLDLMLFLIKKDEINIYDIPIAKITKDFLQYVELAKEIISRSKTETKTSLTGSAA